MRGQPGLPDPARDEAPLEDEPPADTTPEEGEEEDPITMPEGGVATGAGGTAGDNDNAELLLAGGAVLTVGAAGVLLIGRRTPATKHPQSIPGRTEAPPPGRSPGGA